MGCCSSSKVVAANVDGEKAAQNRETSETGRGGRDEDKTKEPETEVAPPGMVNMEEEPLAKRPRCRRAAILPKMHPVAVSENAIRGVFDLYMTEVSEELQKTFDCSWQHLVDEAKKAWDGSGEPLQWYWLVHPEAPPEEAFGLVVLWHQHGFASSHCIISHLSFTQVYKPWHDLIPGVLELLRLQLFQMMPISSIRITIWHQPQDGKMVLDKEVETRLKQAGYRSFSVANGADKRRGQIMSQKRSQERDGLAPRATADLCISSCLLVPGRREVPVVDEVRKEVPGNMLVLAECIQRHCEQSQELPEALQRTLRGLTEVKGSLVRTNRTADAKEWQEFAAECFKDIMVSPELTAWLCREISESVEDEEHQVKQALCGGLCLAVNWKAQRSDDPERFSDVAVQATASKVSESCASPVVYLATEDDEISVMICKLTAADVNLYELAIQLLEEAPPSAFEADRAVSQVRLPRIQHCCVAEAAVGESLANTEFDFAFSRELFGLRFTSRGTPLGALPISPPEKVLTLDTDFLLAVWHEKYTDLQVSGATAAARAIPLFVTRVRP